MNSLLLYGLIPEEWRDVLNKTQEVFPQALIAGGSLRDLDYDFEPKDVDIFIPSKEDTRFSILDSVNKSIKNLTTTHNVTLRDPEPFPEQYLEQADREYINEFNRANRTQRKLVESNRKRLNKQKRKIYHLRRGMIGKYPVDFIFGCKNTCDIKQFDLSFCQISFDGKSIIKTKQYLETEKTGLVTITNRETFKQSRVDKFRQKFSDLEFEVLKDV